MCHTKPLSRAKVTRIPVYGARNPPQHVSSYQTSYPLPRAFQSTWGRYRQRDRAARCWRGDHLTIDHTAVDNWFALASIAKSLFLAAMWWPMVFILSHGIEDGINGQHTAGCHTRQDGRYINMTTPVGLLIILDHRHVNITQCSTTAAQTDETLYF